jgi:hypothetical protein
MAGRSGGRVMLCAICTVHEEMRSAGFLVWPQNQGRWFVSGLTSKPLERFASGLTSKPLGRVSWLSLKTKGDSFSRFGLKTGGFSFSGLALKPAATVW